MSQTFAVPLDTNGAVGFVFNDISNALESLASNFAGSAVPSTPRDGQMHWDTDTNPPILRIYNEQSTAWRTIATT